MAAIRNVLLLLLACVAGSVDAVSYVGLGHVFTANMTGNTVLLGLALGHAEHGYGAHDNHSPETWLIHCGGCDERS